MSHAQRDKLMPAVIPFLIITVDQASKWYAQHFFPGAVVLNPGVSFGVLHTQPMLLQSVLMFLLVGFSIWWVRGIIKGAPHAQLFACGLLLGGGWSNLMDRWTVGAVIDLFSLPFLGITNNLADWSICCGTLWFGWLKAKRLHRSHRI